jgi:membrane-associated protein
METLIEFFQHFTDPQWIMDHGGLYIVLLIVFIETGIFFGFFLPGDSLLFVSGMVIANSLAPFNHEWINLLYWILLISVSGILGNFVGYWFGIKSGKLLFERKDTWLFKKKHIHQAQEFYDKKGGIAIILARFLPIVRTFAPIVAGIVKMPAGKFSFYNAAGSILWTLSIVTAGFLLGENIWVRNNLEVIIIGIILITTGPVLFKLFMGKLKKPVAV